MGREIRRVPPNWKHPIVMRHYGKEGFQPMYDQHWEDAAAEWLKAFDRIRSGVDEDCEIYHGGIVEWAADNPAPEPADYRPWRDEEATWYQVWETVTEGTPVSPPFETEAELISYLSENGDFWDQKRCLEPDWSSLWGGTPGVSGWGHERAERFVKAAWSPSMVVRSGIVLDGKLAI